MGVTDKIAGGIADLLGASLDKGLAPMGEELKRLRRLLMWRAPSDPPSHEQPVLVSVGGNQFFACWRPAEDGDDGYWDSDIDFGGEPVEPDAWFDVPPPNNRHLYDQSPHGAAAYQEHIVARGFANRPAPHTPLEGEKP